MQVPTWHYKVEKLANLEPFDEQHSHYLQQQLDLLGGDGWEAVATLWAGGPNQAYVLFKRQAQQMKNL